MRYDDCGLSGGAVCALILVGVIYIREQISTGGICCYQTIKTGVVVLPSGCHLHVLRTVYPA